MSFVRVSWVTATSIFAAAIVLVGPTTHGATEGRMVVDPAPLTVFGGLTNVVKVAAGPQHIVGVQPDGTLVLWATPTYLGRSDYKPFPSYLTSVVQVSAMWHHGLALTEDGRVHSWGDPFNGPTDVPPGLTNVSAVAAGSSTSYALMSNGVVVGWGNSSSPPASLTNAIALAAGNGWCAALRSGGTVSVWGNGAPDITGLNAAANVISVASGYGRLMALRSDGTVWSSANDVPTGLTNVITIAAGYQSSLALTADGALIKWPAAEQIAGISNVVALGGGFRTLAIADVKPIFLAHPLGRTNYTSSTATFSTAVGGSEPITVQWLRDGVPMPGKTNLSLVLTNLSLTATASYSVAASNALGVTLSSNAFLKVIDGLPVIVRQPESRRAFNGETVRLEVGVEGSAPLFFQWRFNEQDIANANESVLQIPSIQSQQEGSYSVVVSNSLGMVISSNAVIIVRPLATWGTPPLALYRTEPPLDLTNGIALTAGGSHFLAINPEGRLFAWGLTNGVQLVPAGATNVVWISSEKDDTRNLVVTANGRVLGWDYPQTFPPLITTATVVATTLIGSGGANYALTSEGRVIRWSTTSTTTLPWSNIVQIAGGDTHILGLQHDGQLVVDGFNTYGQAVIPPGLSNVVAITTGKLFNLALRMDGKVFAWGDNRYGQCNVPPDLHDVVALTGGTYTSYALLADGTVRAWGRNDGGQAVVPEGLSNVIAIAAGTRQAAALIGPPELRVRRGTTMANPAFSTNSFCLEATTARARTTILEGSNDGLSWNVIKLIAGSDLVQQICDTNATGSFKLYRTRSQ